MGDSSSSYSATAIDSSNIGFQLLKKQGWKEGTGLGIGEQGRLEPVQPYLKTNKRGLGADTLQKISKPKTPNSSKDKNHKEEEEEEQSCSKKSKALSKKMRKMHEFEKRLQEREFERNFFRQFWPDDV
ncbi:G-patch domain-containing protein [Cephalotus follicularis]|uniref:G-patch domain-containing protein n=1 Tax=Cephalotus follicularis TaxID=3775 RepID=A0A1Q3B2W4_CEPFO|nr:G-patch domain-containing protein [Cephalotus follicularis]